MERRQDIYCLEHYLPVLEWKGRAIIQAKLVQDNIPKAFLDWLVLQNRKPKELVSLQKLCLKIGCDAVMQHDFPSVPSPNPVIVDIVEVQQIDLAAYNARYLDSGKEVYERVGRAEPTLYETAGISCFGGISVVPATGRTES